MASAETNVAGKQLAHERACEIFVGHAVTLASELSAKPGGLRAGKNLTLLASHLNQIGKLCRDSARPKGSKIDEALSYLLTRLWDMCIVAPFFGTAPRGHLNVESMISLSGEAIRGGLKVFAKSRQEAFQRFLSDLEEFETQTAADDMQDKEESQKTASSMPEYPSSVNNRLYDILHDTLRCTCLESSSSLVERHKGKLRLRCNWMAKKDNVMFDIILSDVGDESQSQRASIQWQQVRFHVSRRNTDAKHAKIVSATKVSISKVPDTPSPRSQPDTGNSNICEVLKTPIGPVRRSFEFHGGQLRKLRPDPVDEFIALEPSISLNAILERHLQSSRDRIVLAYILARSAWQYYQCEWIMDRWRADSIHFMKERSPDGHAPAHERINPLAPYFVLRAPRDDGQSTREYVENPELLHNYPWLVALGVLLVDICRNEEGMKPEQSTNNVERMNDEFARYWYIVKQDDKWPSLDLKTPVKLEYKKVVECCLNRDIFAEAPTIEERRAVILNQIVHPLQCLLVKMQWLDECGEIPLGLATRKPNQLHQHGIQGSLFSLPGVFDASLANKSENCQGSARETFKRIQAIDEDRYQYIEGDEPIKIAILDTGIDLDHLDFKQSRSRMSAPNFPKPVRDEPSQIGRIKGRKNFCNDRDDEEDVDDSDGHGTHVAGIILRLAPRAELYIARVCHGDARYGRPPAGDATKDKPKATHEAAKKKILQPSRVAEAVEWAIKQGVDIINMSFGFDCINLPPELWSLERSLKNAAAAGILVLAAASNAGNHRPIAWPARDPECAICVHSCDDSGKYSSRFTPSTDDNITNFMVLGEDVSSHWPTAKGGGLRVMSGTSTATPVATSLVALILQYTRQAACETQREEAAERVRLERLRELPGMTSLLKKTSLRLGGYYWIHSSLMWNNYDPGPEARQRDPGLGIKHAWGVILDGLKK